MSNTQARGRLSENARVETDAFVRPAEQSEATHRRIRIRACLQACVNRHNNRKGLQPPKQTRQLKTALQPGINLTTDQVPANPTPGPTPQPRGPTIIAAGLLLAALAVVVLYTSRRAFLSPVAMVVVAAIGVAALLLQRRLRPDLRPHLNSAVQSSTAQAPTRATLRLNAAGVIFAIAAVFADLLHLSPAVMLIAALAAVISFAISGVIVLKSLRQPRP